MVKNTVAMIQELVVVVKNQIRINDGAGPLSVRANCNMARLEKAQELLRGIDATGMRYAVDNVNPREAILGFMDWLGRGTTLSIAEQARLVNKFCDAQGFAETVGNFQARPKSME